MPLENLIVIILICVYVLKLLGKDLSKGLAVASVILIIAPPQLAFQISSSLPIFTIYRCLALVIAGYFIRDGSFLKTIKNAPFVRLIALLMIIKTVSLIISVDIKTSINEYLSYIIEGVLFYFIILNASNRKKININLILKYISNGIIIIAIIGVFEHYFNYNPTDYIASPGRNLKSLSKSGLVDSTFPHPILFGTCLAMGWPIILKIKDIQKRNIQKIWYTIGLIITYSSLYFTFSRGPWIAAVLTLFILTFYRYPKIKITIFIFILLVIFTINVKPGVSDSIIKLIHHTMNPDSLEGSSFYYRFELWKKAFTEVIKSPIRFIAGYGIGVHHSMDLSGELFYLKGRRDSFWSWDNQLATILLEEGTFGLGLFIILVINIFIYFHKNIKSNEYNVETKMTYIVIFASIFVIFFMMSNVQIYTSQLNFFLWINIAIAAVEKKYSKRTNL